MRLYNQNTNKMEKVNVIQHDGVNLYANKLTEDQLNAMGYYNINIHPKPSRRYYNSIETSRLIGNVFTTSYETSDKPVEEVQNKMLASLKETAIKLSERPRVDTGLGYFVDGGRSDKDNFKELWEGMGDADVVKIKDADNIFRDNVSKDDAHTIYRSIVNSAQYWFNVKWTKEEEIKSFTSIGECILYEATPYDVQEEIIIDEVPTGEFNTVTKYKNNVTDWL